jgi:hypothetical protein
MVLAAATAPTASAQIQASEAYTLTQVMDSVTITIAGARPSARGRTIYGGVVPWEASWVAGARVPTTIEIGREFSINDTKVPAGKYTMWVMPRQEKPWLLILDPRTNLNHGSDPDSTEGQYFAHLDVTPVDPVETLTWSINDVRGYGSRVRMEWGDRRVEFGLRLKSTYTIAVDSARAAGLIGEYALTMSDTTDVAWASRMTISHEGGLLRTRYQITPEAAAKYEGLKEYYDKMVEVLIPRAEDLFLSGEAFEGELVQLGSWQIWEFTRENGVATGFEVRGTRNDELSMTGTRLP